MTRINAGIPPAELSDKHLLAEHREIKRIPNNVRKNINEWPNGWRNNLPQQFVLGKGHVRFFYDKLEYLRHRYISIYKECLKRGFNITNFIDAWEGIPWQYMNGWTPTPEAIELIKQRIKERTK